MGLAREKMAKLLCLVAAMLIASAAAAPCAPADVSIVQDNIFTDISVYQLLGANGLQETKSAVFTAEFRLFCKNEQIKDAPVHASIKFRSGSGAFSPVAGLNDVAVMSNEGGSYQFSFVLPAKDTYSGEYTADIFFVGQQTKAASVSMMHSMPAVSGRHMEMLAVVLLGLNAYYANTKFAAAAA